MFQKEYPDPYKFAEISKDSYEFIGGIENDPIQLLSLSWLSKGVVTGSDNSYTTDTGRKLTIEVGESWGSVESIKEDILAATGTTYPYHRLRNALKRSERDGLIKGSRLALPETKGRYGKIYRVSEDVLKTEVSIVEAYHLFYYGDPKDFSVTEVVTRHKGNRKIQKDIYGYLKYAANFGVDTEGYRRIGWWREGEALNADAPVYLPYIIIDLDRIVLYDAYEAAIEIVRKLDKEGFDLKRVFVAYSGRRGFHVYILTNQIGSPIFINSDSAKRTIDRFVDRLFPEIEVDGHTHSPLSLIRLVGSVHNKTGDRKRIFTARDFLKRPYQSLMWKPEVHLRSEMPNPFEGEKRDDAYKLFMETAKELEQEASQKRKKDIDGSNLGNTMNAILGGVEESECWGDKCGRDWAAFVMACWLVESSKQERQVAEALDLDVPFDFGTDSSSWFILREWNKFNNPPLPENILKVKYNSGVKTIGKT